MMKKKTLPFIALAIILVGSTFLNAAKVGEAAPNFTLMDIEGNEHSLSDFAGKYVVLEWINPACPFVVKHYGSGNMQSLQKKWTENGVIWLSIESTKTDHSQHYGKEKMAEFKKSSEAFSTASLMDYDGKVGKMYDARTTPHMYIISPEGELVYNGAIDSIRSANPADIEKAENYVTVALASAKAGEPIEKPTTRAYGCSVKY